MKKRFYEHSLIGKILLLCLPLTYFCLPQYLHSQTLQRYEYDALKMGTKFRLILYASNEETAEKTAKVAFQRVDELTAIFSDYQADSEISRLSISAGTKQKVPVSKELWEVLTLAKEVSKKSRGAFDVTIGPLSILWRQAIKQKTYPNLIQLEEAKKKVGYKYLKLYPKTRSVSLKKKDMRLDVGAIAKGYTVDEVSKILLSQGITTALIDGGGDIYTLGTPPDASGWKIHVRSRRNRPLNLDYFDIDTKVWSTQQEQEKLVYLSHRAIASSGNTYKHLEWQGEKYSHIINPKTGVGMRHNDIINVEAPSCALADALSSTLSVLTPKRGEKFLKKFKNVILW